MALMMTTPSNNPMSTPSSSSAAGQIPIALQHSPSPPPMVRSHSYLRQQQQREREREESTRRGSIASANETSPRAPSVKRGSISATSGAGDGLHTLAEKMTQKDEVRKLANRLATRLQYAAFKVERGWTRHSLPEVENLYWRATRPTSTASAAPSNTRRPSGGSPPRSALLPAISSYTSSQPTAKRSRRSGGSTADDEEGGDGDVFGGGGFRVPSGSSTKPSSSQQQSRRAPPSGVIIGANGQPTPPPSAGTDHLSSSSSSAAPHSLDPSALRASPTRTIQALRAAQAARGGEASASSSGVGTSYADFWSKLGQSSSSRAGLPSASTAPATSQDAEVLQRGKKRPRESDALPRDGA